MDRKVVTYFRVTAEESNELQNLIDKISIYKDHLTKAKCTNAKESLERALKVLRAIKEGEDIDTD